MEIFRFNIVDEETLVRREKAIQETTKCPECGTERQFEHRSNGGDILERATCAACGHREEDSHPVH